MQPDPEAAPASPTDPAALGPLVLFLGDTHDGSTTGVSTQAMANTEQAQWLYEKFKQLETEVLRRVHSRRFYLMLGGDLVEGHHHGSLSFWGTRKQQRDDVIELLGPLATRARANGVIYSVLGTEAHGGAEGEDDAQVAETLSDSQIVARELGAEKTKTRNIAQVFDLMIGGKWGLSWAHHGMTAGMDADTEDSGMILALKKYYAIYKRNVVEYHSGLQSHRPVLPRLLVSHHCHRSPDPVMRHGMIAALCGCWQLQTPHGAKIGPRTPPDIGALIWEPARSIVPERVLYRPEPKVIYD